MLIRIHAQGMYRQAREQARAECPKQRQRAIREALYWRNFLHRMYGRGCIKL